ncbi:MAG: NADPH-dependent FMN reductase [Chlamydiae bacterium CG10_big_fil_rev_8_21_14_0_10_42_34]|nr:MAG: NADPH-dependent FMN reductase [Chlamydiae bacterium CG10_big_fil_rev_8_21_14_0_10_42_34]
MKQLILFLLMSFPLFAEMNVLVFAGSTRSESFNKKLAKQAADTATKLGAKTTLIDLKNFPIPLYDGDLEKQGMPKHAKKLRDLMIQSDAIIIASPEYNGSVSAVLKNALDWASRSEKGSYSNDAFSNKQFVLLSTSPGNGGGVRGLAHLRSIIETLGGKVLDEGLCIPRAFEAFNETEISSLNEQLSQELKVLF